MMLRKVAVAMVLLLAVCSCKKEAIVPMPPAAVLKNVSVQESRVVLPQGGSARIHFSVEAPDFSFSLTEGVVLFTFSLGKPSEVRLSDVRPEAEQGTYSALLSDRGGDNEYDLELRLGIRPEAGIDAFVFSQVFVVKGENAGTHGVVLDTGLPVMYLDTEQAAPIVSKEDFVPAVFSIRSEDSSEYLEETACSVRGRGNTTWEWPKKPYLIRLDKRESLLGMPKHKRWVLLANFMDRTLMRNLVSMKVASMTGLDWTPRCRSIELVLNGKHVGNYLLIEQVRVDKNRVPVTEMTPEDNEGEALTGGYLLELDFHYDNQVQWRDPHGRSHQPGFEASIPFGVKYPDPEDLTPSQLSYIQGFISRAAGALYGDGFTDSEKGYAAYLDVDSFIDYWLVFEVMGNHELGNPGSVYFHKDRGGKLKAGPCWDFDWGVLSYKTSPHAQTGLINLHSIWYDRLFEDPSFREKARARFQELLPLLQTIPAYMDETRERLRPSATLNFKMWNPVLDASMNGGQIINGDEAMSFDAAVDRLITIFEERLSVIANTL